MADRFYGVTTAQHLPVQVIEGAATGGAAAPVEVRVSDTAYANRSQVINALMAVVYYLQTKETTPIA